MSNEHMDSSNRDEDLPAREIIFKELAPLTKFIDAPSDFKCLHKITSNFAKILDLVRQVGDTKTISQLSKINASIEYLITNATEIDRLFPLANPGEKTLHGYKGSHPHYCVYQVLPADPMFSSQWMALVATLLPVLTSLSQKKNLAPDKYLEMTKIVCRSLRQLANPTDFEILVLTELPILPMEILQFKSVFDDLIEDLNIELLSDKCSNLATLHRALEWMKPKSTGHGEKSHSDRSSTGGKRGSQSHRRNRGHQGELSNHC